MSVWFLHKSSFFIICCYHCVILLYFALSNATLVHVFYELLSFHPVDERTDVAAVAEECSTRQVQHASWEGQTGLRLHIDTNIFHVFCAVLWNRSLPGAVAFCKKIPGSYCAYEAIDNYLFPAMDTRGPPCGQWQLTSFLTTVCAGGKRSEGQRKCVFFHVTLCTWILFLSDIIL